MESQLSKSEKKRRAKGVEQLVNELAELPEAEIASLPCPKEICVEIAAARNLKGAARKRQIKYATKLLRSKPFEDLYEYLTRRKGSQLKEKRQFREIEHLRGQLITEALALYEEKMHNNGYVAQSEPEDYLQNSKAILTIVSHFPEIDQVHLKNTAMQYARTRNRKFSRELFRIMKAAVEKKQFSDKQGADHGI